MTTNVGTIAVAFSGDTSKLEAAFAKVRTSLAGTSAPIEAMRKKLGDTAYGMKQVADAGDDVKRGVGAAADGMGRLTPAAERASAKLAQLREHADKLDSRAGKLQTAIGGLSSAFGVAGGRMGDMVGGVADLAMAFAAGGPLMVALLGTGVAVAAIAGHFSEVDKAAAKAVESATRNLQGLKDEVSDLYNEINALGSGRALEEVRLETQMRAKLEAVVAAVPLEARAAFDAYAGSPSFRDPNVESVPHFAEARAHMLEFLALEEKLMALRNKAALEEINALEKEHFGTDKPKVTGATAPRTENEAPMTNAEGVDAIRDMFAGMKDRALVKGLWASPTITPEGANRLAGMDVEEPMIVLSDAMTATASDIEKMSADFLSAGDAALDLRGPLEKLGDAFTAVAGDIGRAALDVAMATMQGGATGGGAALGGIVGGVADMAFGGTGDIGGAVGALLGGILGSALDELVEALGVLAPLFEGVAVVIQALQPILLVVKVLMGAVGQLLGMLAPIIMDLARPIAAVVLVVVRLVEALFPLVGIVLGAVHGLVVFVDVLTMGVKWLDDNFFRPMVSGSRALYNAFADLVNYIVGWFRALPGMEEFGTLLQRVGTYVPPLIDTFSDEMVAATEAVAAFAGEETNIPSGYRVPYYEAETPDGRGNNTDEGGAGAGAGGPIQFLGPVSFVLADEHVAAAIRRESMKKVGRLRDIPRQNAPGRSN